MGVFNNNTLKIKARGCGLEAIEFEWRQRQLALGSTFVLSYHHEMGSIWNMGLTELIIDDDRKLVPSSSGILTCRLVIAFSSIGYTKT